MNDKSQLPVHVVILTCLLQLLLTGIASSAEDKDEKAARQALAKREIRGLWVFDNDATRKSWRDSELKEEPPFQETTLALLKEYRDLYFDTRGKQVIMGDFADENRVAEYRIVSLLGKYNESWVIDNTAINPFDPKDIKFRPRRVFTYDLDKEHARFNDGRGLFRGKVMGLMVWRRLTEAEFAARKAQGASKDPVKPVEVVRDIELPRYKVASHEANELILTAKVWIDTPDGKLPSEEQVQGVFKELAHKTKKRLILHYYVPGMKLEAPAWIVAAVNNQSQIALRRDDKRVPVKLRPKE